VAADIGVGLGVAGAAPAVGATTAAAGGFAGLTAAELADLGVVAPSGPGLFGTGVSGLQAAGLASSVAGTGASLLGSQQTAKAARDAAESQATALRLKAAADKVQAGTEAGYYQRLALQDRRKEQLLLSRQQAVAAAGGGSATDPSTLTLLTDIAGQGEYNALSNLAAGNTREAALKYQSDIDLYQAGRYDKAAGMASTAGLYSGAGTLFSGLGTLTSDITRNKYYGRLAEKGLL
jgi:hypothetical protein